jgi:hypothetical protein
MFGVSLGIDAASRGTFGKVAAILPDQPFPFAADVQHREITRAERRFLDWKAAMLSVCEPVHHSSSLAQPPRL